MNKKITYEEIRDYIDSEETGNGCKLLTTKEEFEQEKIKQNKSGSRVKLKILDNNNHEFKVSIHDFKTRNVKQCTKCGYEKAFEKTKLSNEYVKNFLFYLGYFSIDNYKNIKSKMNIKDKFGYLYYTSFDHFRKNQTPLKFYKSNPYTIYNICLWLKLNDKPFKLISKIYINSKNKLKWKCNNCNYIWEANIHNIISRESGCPKCSESKGELATDNYINDNNLFYISEYRIKECRDKLPLPFDFAIFEDKEKTKLKYLIEYDGEQHFRPIDFNSKGGKEAKKNYITEKRRDKIKDNYCKEHNIKLIRIPYWDFDNIEKILNKELNLKE